VNTVVGHPLDTVKLRMMMTPDPADRKLFKVITQTYSAEGLKGFFKGISPPLWGTVPFATGCFWTNE